MAPAHLYDRNKRRVASGVRAPGAAIGFALRLFGALTAWIAAVTAASAQPPVNSITSCTVITKSGVYELDNSIMMQTLGDCIVISAPNVALNLNGYSITGYTGGAGIRLASDAKGLIQGQTTGIHVMRNAANVFIEGNGATISYFIEGIEIDALNAVAEHFTVSHNGDAGVYLNGAKQARVSNFTADSNIGDGVRIFKGGMSSLEAVTSTNNGRYGIWLKGSSHNTIGGGGFYTHNNAIAGIYLGCWSDGPQGKPCKPALAPSSYNSIFFGNSTGANGGTQDYGIAIDAGDNFNKISDVTSLNNQTDDVIDENSDCGGNVWMSIVYGVSYPPSACIP